LAFALLWGSWEWGYVERGWWASGTVIGEDLIISCFINISTLYWAEKFD
jgi:hypothetical protein